MAANKPFANLDRLSKLVTPTPKPFDYEPQQGSSKVRLDFAQSISLEDRLKQTSLKTTNHLAQYILSDQNAGYIKIKGTAVVEGKSTIQINSSIESVDQGSIVLPPYNTEINQGSVDLRVGAIDSLLRQGAVVSEGIYTSYTTVQSPSSLLQSTTRQGTFTTNQTTFSLTQVEDPKEKVNQGSVVINKILATPNQGSSVVGNVATIGTIENKQGIRRFNQKVVSNVEPTIPTKDIEIVIPQPILIPKKVTQSEQQVPNSITIVSAKPAGAFTSNQNVQIQTLGYLADKASNVLFPTLNHGGELPHNKGLVAINGTTPHAIVDPTSATINDILLGDSALLDTLNPGNISKIGPNNNSETTTQTKNAIKVLSGALSANQLQAAMQGLGKGDSAVADYNELQNSRDGELEDAHYFTVQTVQGVDGLSTNPNIIYGKALSTENTDELGGFISNNVDVSKQKGSVYKKERNGWNNANGRRKYTEINNYSQLQNVVSDKAKNPTPTSVTEYVVSLSSINGSVSFTAFLTSFSDSFTANWIDYNHVGQMDTFKVYKGAVRQLSVAFKVVAGLGEFENTPDSAGGAVTKLNTLVNTAIVGKYEGNYVQGPIVTLTIAGLVKGLKCAIGSVKIDTDVAETGWTDGKPHVYSVSLDAAVLAHKQDNLFAPTTTYLG